MRAKLLSCVVIHTQKNHWMTCVCLLLCIHSCHPPFSGLAVPLRLDHWAPRELPALASHSDSPLRGPRGQAAGRTRIPKRLPPAREMTGHIPSLGQKTRMRRRRERAQPEAVSSSSVHASPGNVSSPAEDEFFTQRLFDFTASEWT